ncbi:MAG: flippase-like domain-containing protein [Candidatus Aenigmarchaeota archaeon]|nr:flippase-like domain-containing protein [Candidatus Aenigmarchaeota archaeon]
MHISKYLPIIGIILFIYVIWSSKPFEIMEIFSKISFLYVSVAIFFGVVISLMRSFRWKMIVNLHQIHYPLKDCFLAWLVGIAAGTVTLGRIGDFIKAFYLKSKEKSFGKCLSTVIVDRIFELSVVIGFALLGIVFLNYFFGYNFIFYIAVFLFAATFILAIYIFSKKWLARKLLKFVFYYFIPKKYKEKTKSNFNSFYDSIETVKNRKKKIFIILFLSAGIWMFSIIQIQIIGLALGLELDYFFLLFIMSLVIIIELIPVTVSGFGTRESFLIFSFSLINIGKESAIAFSLLYYIIAYLFFGIIGFIIWAKRPVNIDISEEDNNQNDSVTNQIQLPTHE